MKKVLLLGGTGVMGTELTKLLIDGGFTVHVTSRQQHGNQNERLIWHLGNAHEEGFLKNVLKEHYDVIVDFMVYKTDEFTKLVSLLLSSTEQYVFISSGRVYANSHTPITEESPLLIDVTEDKQFLSTDEYSLTKARQERILRNFGNNYTIVRPYITYGENRLQLGVWEKDYWLYPLLKGRSLVFSKDIINHLTTLTDSKDVVKALYFLINNKSAIGEIFNITTAESASWETIMNIYLGCLDKEFGIKPKIRIINEAHQKKHPIDKYQVLYDRMYDRVFDNSKILALNDSFHFTPLKEGLELNLKQCVLNNSFLVISNRLCAERDKSAHEIMYSSEFETRRDFVKYLMRRFSPSFFDYVINRL